MYVRLGFAVAAHREPDILLVDEVLAVGDAAFQVQCSSASGSCAARGGRSSSSHTTCVVDRLCGRVLLLNHGRVIACGPSREVIATYQENRQDPHALGAPTDGKRDTDWRGDDHSRDVPRRRRPSVERFSHGIAGGRPYRLSRPRADTRRDFRGVRGTP